MMAPGNAAQRMFADPPKGGRFALEPWTAEGAAGRLAGTGAVGATLSGQFGACLGDIVRGPDPETFRASGTFTAADFPAMRAAADSQGSLQVSHRAVLDTGAPVAAQLAQGGLDLSGQRVVLLTGTSPLNFLGNALLWLARTGMLTRAVFVFESEDDCRRLEGVAPCWWHDPASWGDTFAAGVTGAVDRHCVLGANLNTVLSRPVKWFWAWQLMREGFDVVLMDPDVALFRNLVADDYGLWQASDERVSGCGAGTPCWTRLARTSQAAPALPGLIRRTRGTWLGCPTPPWTATASRTAASAHASARGSSSSRPARGRWPWSRRVSVPCTATGHAPSRPSCGVALGTAWRRTWWRGSRWDSAWSGSKSS